MKDQLTRQHPNASTSALFEKKYTYAFTKDPAELKAYYDLRAARYKEAHDYDMAVDACDEYADIIVAKNGNKVVGGMRLVISSPKNRAQLSLEKDGFDLTALVPTLHQYSYCELGRICVASEEKGSEVSQKLFGTCLIEATQRGCDYIFGSAPEELIPLYAKLARIAGYDCKPSSIKCTLRDKAKEVYLGIFTRSEKQLENLPALEQKNADSGFKISAKL